jgi:quinol monooxygenase YgiN
MAAMNVVHMRVKPGKEAEFLDLHRSFGATPMPGSRSFNVVQTGERMFCIVGEWESMDAMVAARPAMIGNLDKLRPLLEDLGGGRGLTEPWSGNVVLNLPR